MKPKPGVFKIPCFLLLTFICTASFSKSNQTIIDSLWTAYHNTATVSQQIDLLNRLGEQYMEHTSRRDSALILLDKGIEMMDTLESPDLYAANLHIRAFYYDSRGQFDKALPLANKALQLYESTENDERVKRIKVNLGYYHLGLENYEEGIQQLEEAIEMCEASGDKNLKVSAVYNLGLIYRQLGDKKSALKYLLQSLETIKELLAEDPENETYLSKLGTANDAIGSLYFSLGDSENSLKSYQEGYRLRKITQNQIGITVSEHNIGRYYNEHGQLDSAKFYLQKSIEGAKELENIPYQEGMLTTLGTLYINQDSLEKAIEVLKEAKRLNQQTGNKYRYSSIVCALSSAYWGLNDLQSALDISLKAHKSLRELKNQDELVELSNRLSRIYAAMGEKGKALTYLNEAFHLQDSIHNSKVHEGFEAERERLQEELSLQKEKSDLEKTVHENTIRNRSILLLILGAALIISMIFLIILYRKQEKLQSAAIEIQEHSERNQTLNRKLQQFLFAASHDLMESVRKITLFGQLVKKKQSENENANYLDEIIDGGKSMTHILQNLKLYAGLSIQALKKTELNISEAAYNALEKCELDSSCLSLDLAAFETIHADKKSLHELFREIFCNASTFHDKKLPLKLSLKSWVGDAGEKVISITDNGMGIDEKYQDKVLNPFFRIHDRSLSGSGLGLAICEQIMLLHGGKITIDSTPGEGTSIHLHFA